MATFIPQLDNRIRDVGSFKEKINTIPLRIIVEGTRGKSSTVKMLEEMMRGLGKKTFAKVTGEETPLLIYNGIIFPLYRQNHAVLLDYETVPAILNFDIDAIVLENQAITPYTMRHVHYMLHPQHVIIPNIRLDHNETLGSDLEEMVENFINNYRATESKLDIYYGEPIEEVRRVVLPMLQSFAEEKPKQVTLHAIKIAENSRHIPGIENYLLDKYFIERNFGITIDEVEYVRPAGREYLGTPINESEYIRRLESNLKIRQNSSSIRYLNLAKVNDPYSFLNVMDFIFKNNSENVALVAYFRKDRAGRTKLFEDIFPELALKLSRRIRHIWLGGYATSHVFSRLPSSLQDICDYADTGDIDSILAYAKSNNLVLVTMVNSVNPFMNALREKLEANSLTEPSQQPSLPVQERAPSDRTSVSETQG
jgi:hypothetical protein